MDEDILAVTMDQESDQENGYEFNVVLIGDTLVGKNELLNSLCLSSGTGCHIGRSFVPKSFQIHGKQVQLRIWNVSGHDRFFQNPDCKMYGRGASGAMVVYDVTRRSSFENIHRCLSILDRGTAIVMLGNKCDMAEQQEVTKEEGETLATEKGIRFIETSAKNDDNVDEAFTILVRDMILRRELKSCEQFVTKSEVNSKIKTFQRKIKKGTRSKYRSNALMAKTGPKFNFADSTFCHVLRYGVEENYHIRVMLVGKGALVNPHCLDGY